MYISGKYLILYVSAGLIVGLTTKNHKKISLIGIGISALIGASFNIAYAFISAIEFAIGLGLAKLFFKKEDSDG